MPKDIQFIAVEVSDVYTVPDVMTEDVEKAVPAAVQAVLKVLND
jgi:Ni,Fe-hydrogenase maturation factor